MMSSLRDRISKSSVVRLGDREIVAEGLRLSFWADISHRCMTASWPSFVAGAVTIFVVFNAAFGFLYWLGNNPVSNVTRSDYLDYLYFSIETLSTAGYGDMHPQTHYGHFVAAVELFTGIFSMSVMTGLIFARFSRPRARLLFADNPVISVREGKPTLMVRLANERHNIIGNATARLWVLKNIVNSDGESLRRFSELALEKKRAPSACADLDALSRHRRNEPPLQSRFRRHEGCERIACRRRIRLRCCCGANHPCPQLVRPYQIQVRPTLCRYSRRDGGRSGPNRLRQVP